MNHVNRWDETPVFAAARKNHLGAVQLLEVYGANMNHKNFSGQTATEFYEDARARIDEHGRFWFPQI